LEFNPERFLSPSDDLNGPSEKVTTESNQYAPYTYLPFSGGPRSCIGKPFAEIEIKLLIAMLAQRYDWVVQRPESWKNRHVTDLFTDGTTLRPLPHMVRLKLRK
jgi:cytochrome P450